MNETPTNPEPAGQPRFALTVLSQLPWEDRIHAESFQGLLDAIQTEIDQAFGNRYTPFPGSLQIDFALFPDGNRYAELNATENLASADSEKLLGILQQLPVPLVRDIVAFVVVAVQPGAEMPNLLPPFKPSQGRLPVALKTTLRQSAREARAAKSRGLALVVRRWIAALGRWRMRRERLHCSQVNLRQDRVDDPPLLGSLSTDRVVYILQLLEERHDQRAQLYRNDAHYFMARGVFRSEQGDLSQAICDFTEVIRLAPDTADAYLQRGWCFSASQQLKLAIQDAYAALDLCPNDPECHLLRGEAYFKIEAWQAAEADFSRCIELDGLCSRNYFRRALARWYQPDRQGDTVDDVDQALKLNPYDFKAIALRLTISGESDVRDEHSLSRDQTADYLDRANRYGPPNPRLLTRRAYLHFRSDEPELALVLAARATAVDENFIQAIAVRGLAHFKLDDYEQAFADLTQAIQGEVDWPEIYCYRAHIFSARQEYESAARDADQAIALNSQYAPAWLARGTARGNMEDHEAAHQDFLRARDLDPSWPSPYYHLGIVYQIQEDFETACEHFSRVIELDRDLAPAWMRRGICRLAQRQEALALDDLNRALELETDLVPALEARAELWAVKNDFQRAADDLTAALRLEPEDVSLLYSRAQAWTQLQEYNRACGDFNQIIRLCPGLAAAYTGRGYIWTQIGQQFQAEQDYQEAILCDPQSANQIEIHKALAEAAFHHRNERYGKAIERTTVALELDPNCQPALNLRASAYWYDEEFIEAVDDYSKLLELDKDSFIFLSSRGQVYVEMKEFTAGLADLDRAIQLGCDSQSKVYLAYARSGRALALAGLDRFNEAHDDFEASIIDCPENAWVHYNHGRVYDKLGEHHKAALCFQLSLALDDPCLTPRKRERARAYCERHLQPPSTAPTPGRSSSTLCLVVALVVSLARFAAAQPAADLKVRQQESLSAASSSDLPLSIWSSCSERIQSTACRRPPLCRRNRPGAGAGPAGRLTRS